MIDVTGKTVSGAERTRRNQPGDVDATAFASGVYSVKISNGEFHKVIRLVRK